MRTRRETNVGVAHGQWGEDTAVAFLRTKGFTIVGRNETPCPWDRRLEIDVVAYDPKSDAMVFVEVKQHAARNHRASRLRSITREKRANLRRACNAWRRYNRWTGGYRFDVIEIYGVPEAGRPEIDHIERVNLFTPRNQFVNWCD